MSSTSEATGRDLQDLLGAHPFLLLLLQVQQMECLHSARMPLLSRLLHATPALARHMVQTYSSRDAWLASLWSMCRHSLLRFGHALSIDENCKNGSTNTCTTDMLTVSSLLAHVPITPDETDAPQSGNGAYALYKHEVG